MRISEAKKSTRLIVRGFGGGGEVHNSVNIKTEYSIRDGA